MAGPLMRMRVTGGDAEPLPVTALATSYDVVETGVYYIAPANGDRELRYFDFRTQRSTIVATNLGRLALSLAASRDGRRILFARTDSVVDDLMLVERFR
jgi:hypothetical protein